MKDSLLKQCLDVLKREDVKTELKLLLNPIIEFILFEIKVKAKKKFFNFNLF